MMNAGPETANAGYHFVFIFKQPQFLVTLEHQVLQRLVRNAKLTRYVHRKLLRVEVFDPTAPGDTNLRIREELNVCRGVDLQRRNENVINILGPDVERSEGVYRSLTLLTHEFSTFTKTATPTLVQLRQIRGWTSVNDRGLAVTANHYHPKVELHPIIPMTHPVNFWPR